MADWSLCALRELLNYNPATGELRWNVRTVAHIECAAERSRWNKRYANKIAGAIVKALWQDGFSTAYRLGHHDRRVADQ